MTQDKTFTFQGKTWRVQSKAFDGRFVAEEVPPAKPDVPTNREAGRKITGWARSYEQHYELLLDEVDRRIAFTFERLNKRDLADCVHAREERDEMKAQIQELALIAGRLEARIALLEARMQQVWMPPHAPQNVGFPWPYTTMCATDKETK